MVHLKIWLIKHFNHALQQTNNQGTGLGLSLAYDIVKTHGGEIKVETVEGEGIILITSLPML